MADADADADRWQLSLPLLIPGWTRGKHGVERFI